MDPHAVGSGMISDAWGYVYLVYGATWLVVVGLSVRAFLAARAAESSEGAP